MLFEIENNVIASYKRLSYEPWFAFAEFVDNSTQAYFDNREGLDQAFERTGEKLRVQIFYSASEDKIVISDNSMGMDQADLERAFKVGMPPPNPSGRSKYGLGMKTAACWFGNVWTLETKKLGSNEALKVTIDVDVIAKTTGQINLPPTITGADPQEHYTILTITDLNKTFVGRTLWKIRDYLSSIYRFDIQEGIEISWNGNPLEWKGYDMELFVTEEGIRFKENFGFEVNKKQVKGWVGVLGKGFATRKKAGFSIIQNRRVVQTNFKPESLFGDQDEGTNDLVNQRLVGELFLDQFSVSHTKDMIVWEEDEESTLNRLLGEYCDRARDVALTARFKKGEGENRSVLEYKEQALAVIGSELKSAEIGDFLSTIEPLPEEILAISYKKSSYRVTSEISPSIEAHIGSEEQTIYVTVFFSEKSEFEPYVLMETTVEQNRVVVIINGLHPHVQEMQSADGMTNFVRQCVYDGVAEWKAVKLRGNIQPNTTKFLKDQLLRLPYRIKSNLPD
ncbi:MAG: hypothetical protein EOP48_04590 [Sphingobacteriales bacterium]|nr:MAG: hypothetical protein EOP48_04590 [Sphingobacteriales bacterium]